MSLRLIGSPLFEQQPSGKPVSRIATVFPRDATLITVPGIHATQRAAYYDFVSADRQRHGLDPLTPDEEDSLGQTSVDLIVQNRLVLIRPNPHEMGLAFEGDDLLQQIVSKRRIRFLDVAHDLVHAAIKRRGECWRITPPPQSTAQIQQVIRDARIGIGGRAIYRYNITTGTRWLTCRQLSELSTLDTPALRQHLLEIQEYCGLTNRRCHAEVDFFLADSSFRDAFLARPLSDIGEEAVREAHRELAESFTRQVPADLRQDDLDNMDWRQLMFTALVPQEEHAQLEEERLGLSREFHMHIQWLPGGRIENGELIYDSVFEEPAAGPADAQVTSVSDPKARSLVFNYVRQYGTLQYINVGRVIEPLTERNEPAGRRGVYVVEMKQHESAEEIVKIVRMQKWDTWERLDEGQDLLQAMVGSEEYAEYVLDRGLGCRRLGMNLGMPLTSHRVREIYQGSQVAYRGTRIWTPYFERDYIRGMATERIASDRFGDPEFARRFAELLGRAAAPNMIVGRCAVDGEVRFDDGDEILVEDERQQPADLLLSHFTGAFTDYERPLVTVAVKYALPIIKRFPHVPDRVEFAERYVTSLLARFVEIQQGYRDQRRAYDTLFHYRGESESGSLTHRWELVLKRLDNTDLARLEHELRRHLMLPDVH